MMRSRANDAADAPPFDPAAESASCQGTWKILGERRGTPEGVA